MGYLDVWKVLEEMVTDFRKKGIAVPAEVINNLRNSKTTIKILKADPNLVESAQKIEEYLGNVESYLVSEGHKWFGWGYVDEWLKLVDEAGRKTLEEEEKEKRFIPGFPRKQKWIRVTASDQLPLEELRMFAKEVNLSYTIQENGCLIVHGEDESLKDFVKKLATKCRLKTGNSAEKNKSL